MFWRIIALLLFGCLLTGCSEKEPEQAAAKPTILSPNYPIANVAYQLAGGEITVIYPAPKEVDPATWTPAAAKISTLEVGMEKLGPSGLLLAFKSDEQPDWVQRVAAKSGQMSTLPALEHPHNPEEAAKLVDAVAKVLSAFVPAAAPEIESRRSVIQRDKLAALRVRWEKLAESGELRNPEDLETGVVRPANGDFFGIVERNLAKFEKLAAAPKVEEPEPMKLGGNYDDLVAPLVNKYCIECHDSDTEEGEVNFDVFVTKDDAENDPDFWDRVFTQMDLQSMPPPKEKSQPSKAEREALMAWIDKLSGRWDNGEFGRDPGRTTIRRLNKNEYNYTVRDLFGLQLRPADGFPEDSGGEAGFDNNADALFLAPLLMENYVEAAGLVAQAVFNDGNARGRYVFATPGDGLTEVQAAKTVLRHWGSAAFRRPIRSEELERLVQIYQHERNKKKSYGSAMQMPLVAILISPHFLYRSEVEKKRREAYLLDSYDLANRLSYFLWSSMPDPTLFKLAKSGELQKPEVVEAQVQRMLQDERASALAMHFAGQWFGWEALRSRANPDEKRYPQFTFQLRVAMYRESAEFFEHLLATNASAYDLIDCNYAFLNEQLAKHYRIPGVTGNELRKVQLTDRNRGGVLGMGSVLVATSLPLRSSPAVRGDYVLTELLGTPPPEPPMNVEQLPEDDREVGAKSFREALEQHREDPNCRSCHETIDPIGFGMENFDAIGRWRTKQNNHPIDATGEMPDGSQIASPADIKQFVMNDKELFVRTMVEKLLSYALGRELTPYDRPVIAEISEKVIADDGRIVTAFVEVAKSYPFRYRRNEQFDPTL